MNTNVKNAAKLVPMSLCFSVGAVLFSSHAGGGFASGNQAYQNFVVNGWLAPISAIIAMLVLTITIREAMFLYNSRGLKSYKELFNCLYSPFDRIGAKNGKAAFRPEWLFEIFFYIMVLMAVAAAISTAASTLQQKIGLNYYTGIVLVGCVILLLTIFGVPLVRRASTVMGIAILATSVTIFAIGIFLAPDLKSAISTSFAADGFSKLPKAVMTGFVYAGFQCVVIPTMIVCGAPLTTRKACKNSMWISFGLNAVALTLSVFMLLGWAPVYTAVEGGVTIPTLTALNQMGMPWLSAVYSICLILCLISTGVTTVFGFTARFEKAKALSGIKSSTLRSAIVSALIMIAAMCVSTVGLSRIIKYGYGYCGYLAVAIIIIPFLTVGVYKNRRYVAEHPEYAGVPAKEIRRREEEKNVAAAGGAM